MGLLPTHRDESPLLRFIDSKQVTRDFRRSSPLDRHRGPFSSPIHTTPSTGVRPTIPYLEAICCRQHLLG